MWLLYNFSRGDLETQCIVTSSQAQILVTLFSQEKGWTHGDDKRLPTWEFIDFHMLFSLLLASPTNFSLPAISFTASMAEKKMWLLVHIGGYWTYWNFEQVPISVHSARVHTECGSASTVLMVSWSENEWYPAEFWNCYLEWPLNAFALQIIRI